MASRKLQAEIEKVLKKVAEGVEVFEGIFDKIQSATNPTQKDKYETDLKKEIKKLQRFRDQIKTWQASNDIKDKRPLVDNRRLIETQMERFKACEKELKTKAFSKEGLNAAAKIDPREQEKDELTSWVTDTVEQLNLQVEKFEAEQESLQLAIRKSKKNDHSKTERLAQAIHQIERHKFHMTKLEIILRMLENGNLPFEEVRNIQEDVNFYVESNQDPDFAEDEGIYDELSLEEAEAYGFANEDEEESEQSANEATVPQTPPKKEMKDVSPTELAKKDDATGAALRRKGTKDKETVPDESQSPSKAKAIKKTTEDKAKTDDTTKGPTSKPSPLPKIAPLPPKPGSGAQGLVGTKIPAVLPEPPAPMPQRYASAAAAASAMLPESSSTRPAPLVASVNIKDEESRRAEPLMSSMLKSPAEEKSAEPSPISSQRPIKATDELIKKAMEETLPRLDDLKNPLFSDLLAPFEGLHWQKRQMMLDCSFQHQLEAADSEKPFSYMPNQPYPTPGYYPQVPFALFETNPLIFENFDTDTLFFIFYYQQGTYQQFLAASQLKRHSWRFHKKYLTWFQRHEEPKSITDEFEQGTYIYFDYEGAWCRRKKADFRFEYRFLDD